MSNGFDRGRRLPAAAHGQFGTIIGKGQPMQTRLLGRARRDGIKVGLWLHGIKPALVQRRQKGQEKEEASRYSRCSRGRLSPFSNGRGLWPIVNEDWSAKLWHRCVQVMPMVVIADQVGLPVHPLRRRQVGAQCSTAPRRTFQGRVGRGSLSRFESRCSGVSVPAMR